MGACLPLIAAIKDLGTQETSFARQSPRETRFGLAGNRQARRAAPVMRH